MKKEKSVEIMLKIWGKEYKKGFVGYFILMFLKERPMYGFEIGRRLQEMSRLRMEFQESGIYQLLKKLSARGMVSTEWRESDKGPRRKYYTLELPGEELLAIFTGDFIIPVMDTAARLIGRHFPHLVGKGGDWPESNEKWRMDE